MTHVLLRSVVATSRSAARAALFHNNCPPSSLAVMATTSSSSSSFHSTSLSSQAIPERHGTTIVCVRKNGKICMMGDGMVSQGNMIVKSNTNKIRVIKEGTLVGFAGSTADAFTLLERLEGKLDEYPGQLTRSCVELAKGWRTDKYLRRLEASLVVADENVSLEVTGNGDVLESQDGILGVGSGSPFAIGKICISVALMICVFGF